MRLAFISDIHGNLEALSAVLKEIDAASVDGIYCLGDVVGYGANPAECLELVQKNCAKCILGNHDEYVSSFDDSGYRRLRDDVKKSIAWTQSQLKFEDLNWFLKLPMTAEVGGCTLIHSSFAPQRWSYCFDANAFYMNFKYQKVPLAFCGHSHYPMIGVDLNPGEMPYLDDLRPGTKIPNVGKVMVNVGSVGQPRDYDSRACFVVYDTDEQLVKMHRVEYDIAAAQKKIADAGLPEVFARRLSIGR